MDSSNPSCNVGMERGPESYDVPTGMRRPPTKRQCDIINRTAEKCASQPQFEVFLKLKQSDDTETFGFLQPQHELYPFYRSLLVQHQNKQADVTTGNRISLSDCNSCSAKEEPKGGLASIEYSSSSSDEETEDGIDLSIQKTALSENGDNLQSNVRPTSATRNEGEVTAQLKASQSSLPTEPDASSDAALLDDNNNNCYQNKLHTKVSPDETSMLSSPSAQKQDGDDANDTQSDVKRRKRLKRAQLMKGHYALKLMKNDGK